MPVHRAFHASILAMTLAAALAGCSESPDPSSAAVKPELAKPVADPRAVAALELTTRDLYAHLSTTPGNLLIAPAGIVTALGLASAGASGATASEMAAMLHQPVPDHRAIAGLLRRFAGAANYEIASATALWASPHLTLAAPFQAIATGTYDASIAPVDFAKPAAAAKQLNDWVAERTHGRISEVLHSGDFNAVASLVLCSTLWFHGRWEQPFPPAATRPDTFRSPTGPRPVMMMHLMHTLPATTTASAQVVELPYVGGDLHLLLVVPTTDDGLAAVERAFQTTGGAAFTGGLAPRPVELAIPRCRLDWRGDLIPALRACGMRRAFDRSAADFSALGSSPDRLYLDRVAHRAAMEFDEQGTVAAAAITIEAAPAAAQAPDPDTLLMTADHPFLFLIRDQAGTVLVIGRVVDPQLR